MDEFTYVEEFNLKSTVIKGIVLVIVLVICGFLFYIYKEKHTLQIKDNIKLEIGTKLKDDLNIYLKNNIKDKKDYYIDLSDISTSNGVLDHVGEYTIYVKYKSVRKKGTVKVIDKESPRVKTTDLTIGVKEDYELDDFILECNDYSKPCNVTYKRASDESLSNKAGTYNFDIIISDTENNKTTKRVKLIVKEGFSRKDTLASDLNYVNTDPKYDDFKGVYAIKFNKGYDLESVYELEEYIKLTEISNGDLHPYIDPLYANNRIDETDIVMVLNKNGYVIGLALRLKLDNKKVFYINNINLSE